MLETEPWKQNNIFLQRWYRRIADMEWLILALLLPAVLFSTPLTYFILLIIPLLWLSRKVGYGYFVSSTPVDLAILGVLSMTLVSLYATPDIALSAPRVAGMVYGVAVFYAAVAATGRSRKKLAIGVALLLACGVAVAALSLIGTKWTIKFPILSSLTAILPQATLLSAAPEGFSPNQVAGTLLWVLPVSIAVVVISLKKLDFWYRRLTGWRALPAVIASVTIFLLMGGTFLLTQSRSGYIGIAFALLYMLVLGLWARKRRFITTTIVLLVIVIAVSVARLLVSDGRQPEALEKLNEVIGIEDAGFSTDNLQTRLEIWSRALYGIEDFPFTGMGIGTFRQVSPVLYPLFLVSPDQDIAHAHNQLLQIGLDLGIPGLVAFLALWLGTITMLWQTWRAKLSISNQLLVLGFSAALLGYFVYGLTDTVALGAKPGFVFWLLFGLISGLYRLTYVPVAGSPANIQT